jgi:hypothetical protein
MLSSSIFVVVAVVSAANRAAAFSDRNPATHNGLNWWSVYLAQKLHLNPLFHFLFHGMSSNFFG